MREQQLASTVFNYQNSKLKYHVENKLAFPEQIHKIAIITGYEKVQRLLDLHARLNYELEFFLIAKTKHQAYRISNKIVFLYPNSNCAPRK